MSYPEDTEMFHETVLYAGIPLKRGDVYRHCVADGFSHAEADAIAFGYASKTDLEPWSLDEFRAFIADVDPSIPAP